ncbi:MAG: hypothetical protein JWN79_1673 [Gemmatimonadetes bacterium]|nr:hypothetical protein [Gemmatimonadota bacterium]
MSDADALRAGADLPVAGTRQRLAVGTWPLALAVLGVSTLLLGLVLLVRSPIVVTGDDAMYVILARSLATGQGYRFLNLPGAPAATHFPPGFPALLALLWRAVPDFPANLTLFKSVNAISLALVAVGVARFARYSAQPRRSAIALGVLAAVSGPLLILGNMLLSELVFLALLLFLLPVLEGFAEGGREPSAALRAATLGVAIGLCALVRTHAVVLIPAVALVLARRRRWRDAALLSAAAILTLVPWQLWSAHHAGAVPAPLLGQYDSYLGWWVRGYAALGPRMIPMTLERTLAESGGMFAVLFSPGRSPSAHALTLVALAGLAIAGIVAVRRRLPVTLLFLAGYLAIVALWPFPPARFLWGVWPLILLLLVAGAHRVVDASRAWRSLRVTGRALVLAGAAASLWVGYGYAAYELRMARGRWWTSIPRANAARIVPAVRWTLANTAPGDLLAAEDDGALYLYTGRRTVPIRTFAVEQYLLPISPQVEARAGLLPLLAAYPISAVVVGSPTTFATVQWAAAQPTSSVSFREQFAGGAAFTILRR